MTLSKALRFGLVSIYVLGVLVALPAVALDLIYPDGSKVPFGQVPLFRTYPALLRSVNSFPKASTVMIAASQPPCPTVVVAEAKGRADGSYQVPPVQQCDKLLSSATEKLASATRERCKCSVFAEGSAGKIDLRVDPKFAADSSLYLKAKLIERGPRGRKEAYGVAALSRNGKSIRLFNQSLEQTCTVTLADNVDEKAAIDCGSGQVSGKATYQSLAADNFYAGFYALLHFEPTADTAIDVAINISDRGLQERQPDFPNWKQGVWALTFPDGTLVPFDGVGQFARKDTVLRLLNETPRNAELVVYSSLPPCPTSLYSAYSNLPKTVDRKAALAHCEARMAGQVALLASSARPRCACQLFADGVTGGKISLRLDPQVAMDPFNYEIIKLVERGPHGTNDAHGVLAVNAADGSARIYNQDLKLLCTAQFDRHGDGVRFDCGAGQITGKGSYKLIAQSNFSDSSPVRLVRLEPSPGTIIDIAANVSERVLRELVPNFPDWK